MQPLTSPNEKPDPLTVRPDPAKAASACRQLIRVATTGQGDFDKAVTSALAAFGLPANYCETEGGRWQ